MKKDSDTCRIELHRLTVPDAIVAVLILSFSLVLIVHASVGSQLVASKPIEAAIYHDGTLVGRLSLQENQQQSINGGKMLIETKDGKVRITRSDCPRQFCVHQGWATHAGEAIICIPFKTLIEVQSTAMPVVDAVIY